MELKKIEDIFSEMSEGLQALISGVVLIITAIFLIYAVFPIYGDHPIIVLFSILALVVCFLAPVFFRLPEMTLVPDVVGWLLTGVSIAIFGWIIFHGGYFIDIVSLRYIFPAGLLGFASSIPLTEGVLLPLYGERSAHMFQEEEDEFEEEFESDFDEGFEEEEESYEEPSGIEPTFNDYGDEEDEGPW